MLGTLSFGPPTYTLIWKVFSDFKNPCWKIMLSNAEKKQLVNHW
jgi:hypothetical protein